MWITTKRQVRWGEAQSSLKDEIVELQKELEGQTMQRSVLEKALNHEPKLDHVDDPAAYKLLLPPPQQPAEDLITEIARLEMEVVYLEKYLLSLYRKSFAKRVSTPPKTITNGKKEEEEEESGGVECCIQGESDPLIDSGIYRSHSSLSHHSACSFRASPVALDPYHSLPLSMLERTQESTSNAAAAYPTDETPNWLSEEMIKCISTIYSHLSDPPQQLHLEAPKEFSETFFSMVDIRSIVRDSQALNSVQDMLQSYKLGQVDPWKLNHEEKLAFWINVHNALVMHAFLVYGVPRGSLKKVSLVLKAAYNIGGNTVSVDTIQSCILRCRLPRPTLWLHSLFLRKTKFKGGDPRKAYAIKYSEPRLHFALCSGCQSDPPVRLYTPKRVFQELEMAKEEYIQMNIKIHKEQRLVMPKNVEYFTKEMGLSPLGIAEMLEHAMPEYSGKICHQRKLKKVEWLPHNFSFRFLLTNDLVK